MRGRLAGTHGPYKDSHLPLTRVRSLSICPVLFTHDLSGFASEQFVGWFGPLALFGWPKVACGSLSLSLYEREEQPSERWESGNSAGVAEFPRGGGDGGKPVCGFPPSPRARLFHGSPE